MKGRIGQQLGNYRLVSLLGEGSFAEVYLGEHVYLNRQAAIKVLRGRLVNDAMKDFLTEARTIASLEHPHIVRVLDFGVEDSTPFLVMNYARNGTLRHRHPESISLPPTIILSYVKQIAAALQYAHDKLLIHRDIKPRNMLLGPNNEVWLSDFGTVQMARSTISETIFDLAGTPSYMAPEQFQGKPRLASDQYALGVVVYEWLCGERPFNGSFTELYSQHMFVPPPPLHEKMPEISPAVEEVLLTALAKDPHQRFASVQAFANALERACQLESYLISASSFILPPLAQEAPISTPLAPEEPYPFVQPAHAPGSLYASATSPDLLTPAQSLALASRPPSVAGIPAPSQLPAGHKRKLSRRSVLTGLVGSAIVVAGGIVAWEYALNELSGARSPATHTPPLGTTLYTYTGHSNAVKAVAWAPHNGKRIASASLDRTVQVWDATTGDHILKYNQHSNGVKTVAWSPNGVYIASGSLDATVRVWNATTGSDVLSPYKGHSKTVRSVAWSPDGKYIASSSDDTTVQVWEAATGNLVLTYHGHASTVFSIAWSPNGQRIVSGSDDQTARVQVWDVATGGKNFFLPYSSHTDRVEAVAWSPDGQRIASASYDHTVQVWDASTGHRFFSYNGHKDQVEAVAWSPGGKYIASGSGGPGNVDHTVQVWDASTGHLIFPYRGHSNVVWMVAWSPDGQRIASGSSDMLVKVWQA